MRRILLATALAFLGLPAFAQMPGGMGPTGGSGAINAGSTPLTGCATANGILFNNSSKADCSAATVDTSGNINLPSATSYQISADTILSRLGAANWQLGAADAAAPVAQSLSAQSVVTGTSNTAGQNWTFKGSRGTGTGAGGSLVFQIAPAGGSGSTPNALANVMVLDSTQQATFGAGNGLVAWPSAALWQFGGNNAAAPTNQVIGSQGARGGTDTNTAGSTLRIRPGLGTGTGTRPSLILQGVDTTGSGTGQQTATDIVTVSYNATGSSTPVLQVSNPSTNSGQRLASFLAPNMNGSQGVEFYIGKALTANNGAMFLYRHVADNSSSNHLDVISSAGGTSLWSWAFNGTTTIGDPAGTATPPAQTLATTGSRAGTDTNVGGANLTIQSGTGTGTGTASSLILQAPVTVASGSGAQTQTTVVTVTGLRASMGAPLKLKSYTVGTLPTGSQGDTAYVTDHNAACALGATATGGGANVCKVWHNGTNWIIG